jgi:hypothetical protein
MLQRQRQRQRQHQQLSLDFSHIDQADLNIVYGILPKCRERKIALSFRFLDHLMLARARFSIDCNAKNATKHINWGAAGAGKVLEGEFPAPVHPKVMRSYLQSLVPREIVVNVGEELEE